MLGRKEEGSKSADLVQVGVEDGGRDGEGGSRGSHGGIESSDGSDQ